MCHYLFQDEKKTLLELGMLGTYLYWIWSWSLPKNFILYWIICFWLEHIGLRILWRKKVVHGTVLVLDWYPKTKSSCKIVGSRGTDHIFWKLLIMVSVGLNSEITNFELLWTIEAELQTLSNLGLPTKMELQTHPNPPKIQNSEPANWIWPNTNKHHLMIAVHDQTELKLPKFRYFRFGTKQNF